MARMLFEDDNKVIHEMNLSTIKVKDLKEGDVVLATYEVGNATTQEATFALSQLNDMLKGIFGQKIKVTTIATRHGTKDVDIKIVSGKNA